MPSLLQIHLSDAGRNEHLRGGEPLGGARVEETERIIGELNARYGGRMRGVRSNELPEHLRKNLADDAVAVFDPSTGRPMR